MNASTAPQPLFQRLVSHLFALSTVLFMIGGLVIVVGQLVMIVVGNGEGTQGIADTLGPYVFGTSTVAGLFAFVLSYFKKKGVKPRAE